MHDSLRNEATIVPASCDSRTANGEVGDLIAPSDKGPLKQKNRAADGVSAARFCLVGWILIGQFYLDAIVKAGPPMMRWVSFSFLPR